MEPPKKTLLGRVRDGAASVMRGFYNCFTRARSPSPTAGASGRRTPMNGSNNNNNNNDGGPGGPGEQQPPPPPPLVPRPPTMMTISPNARPGPSCPIPIAGRRGGGDGGNGSGGGNGSVGGGGGENASPSPPLPPLPASMAADVEYRDGQIACATLDALVHMLRPGGDPSFSFTFLLCARVYVRPHELLATLVRRHVASGQILVPGAPCDEDAAFAEMVSLVQLLGEWTNSFPYDFRDDRMMALVRNITQRCAAELCDCETAAMTALREVMSDLLQKLLDRLTALEQYEATLRDLPYANTIGALCPTPISHTGLPPASLARQLTLLELHLLSFVGPEEFIQAFIPTSLVSSKEPAEPGRAAQHEPKRTRNLEAYGKWFNRLNFLVASDILKCHKTKARARILEHWILCARECFNLGNFNSLMAIVGALSMVCIARLKKTWARCTAVIQQLPPLERCMEPSSNHARYRASLSAASTSRHPAVPCFSITCRDIHFINQTAPSKLYGNRINMDKCRSLAKQIFDQVTRSHVDTGFERHDPTWEYLLKTPILSENVMEYVSFEREGPTDHNEKERYKALRHARKLAGQSKR